MLYARLSRFYSISYLELKKLPEKDLRKLFKAMTQIKAEESLNMLTVNNFANIKKDKRNKIMDEFYKNANIKKDQLKVDSFEELAGLGVL